MTAAYLRPLLGAIITVASATATAQTAPLHYFGQTPQSYQSPTAYGNNPGAGHFVQSDDARIYYEVYGSGQPVAVLHGGIVGSPAEMGQFIDKLKTSRQVIAVSTRGHGKSEAGSRTPSYAQKARDLAAVLDAVTREPADIIGFSDGAYTGYQFAADYPQKIRRLVAIGAGQWIKGGPRSFSADYDSVRQIDPRYWAEQAGIRPAPGKTAVDIARAVAYYNQAEFGKPQFAKVAAPVLVLAGENDLNAPLDTVLSAYKMLPQAQLAIIPAAGHSVFLQNFPAVWESMRPFLAEK